MTRKPSQRGFTLIEAMVAMGVLLIGAVGMASLHAIGSRVNGDARRITRATAIAQDLLNQIELWDFNDARLANVKTTNDTDVGDSQFAFEGASPVPDHDDSELDATYLGIPTAQVKAGGYERYWNVTPDASPKQVAVIVRWPQGGGWRRVVLLGIKVDPRSLQ